MIGNSVFRFNHPQEAEKLREINQVKLFINKSNRNNNFNQICNLILIKYYIK